MTEEIQSNELDTYRKQFAALRKFVIIQKASEDVIGVRRVYVHITGSINTALVLDELVFWTVPDKSGGTGLRVKKDGVLWLAVQRSDWWDRKCLTPKQADLAIKKLVQDRLIIKGLFKFNGVPTVHIRLNIPVFFDAIKNELGKALSQDLETENEEDTTHKDISDLYEMLGSISPESKSHFDQRSKSILPKGENLNSPNTTLTQNLKTLSPQAVKPAPKPKAKKSRPKSEPFSGWPLFLEPYGSAFVEVFPLLAPSSKGVANTQCFGKGDRLGFKHLKDLGITPEVFRDACEQVKSAGLTVSDITPASSIKSTAVSILNGKGKSTRRQKSDAEILADKDYIEGLRESDPKIIEQIQKLKERRNQRMEAQ